MPAFSLLSLVLALPASTAATQGPAPLIPAMVGVSFASGALPASTAGDRPTPALALALAPTPSPWRLDVDFRPAETDVPQSGPPPAVAFQYSDGYKVRLRIHRDASYAMLPLFGAEAVVGEDLFKNPNSQGLKTAHAWLNVGILGLFGLDTITGLWNLKEGWQDPHGRTRRLIHSLLMLTADVGFVATDRLAPSRRAVAAGDTSGTVTHRDVAIISISVATVGYLIMVFR